MYRASREQQGLLSVRHVLALGAFLILVSLAFNLKEQLVERAASVSPFPIVPLVVNGLLIGLAVYLILSARRALYAARERERMESVLSGIQSDTLLVVRPDRTIAMCNESVRRMFGYEPEEVLDRKTDLLYSDRRTAGAGGREIYEALEREGFHVGSASGRRRSGDAVPLEIITGALPGKHGAVLLLRDVSERLKADADRRELEEKMRRRQKVESLGVLAGGAAHDFKNVIAVVRARAELGQRYLGNEAMLRENFREIESVCQRAEDLSEQMMAFAGKARLAFQSVDLSGLVRQTGEFMRPTTPGQHALQFNLLQEPPALWADPTQLRQVTMNLIQNASEAIGSRPGTITLSTGCAFFDPGSLRDGYSDEEPVPGRYLYLSVRDTGCGMDARTRERILDPFFTTKSMGHGLGLAAVLGIVRAHKGILKVESEPEQGATFTVLLPCPK